MKKVKGVWVFKKRVAPRQGTKIRALYDELSTGKEVVVPTKEKNNLQYLRDFYDFETRNVGGGKYVAC
jgi:hypothetical protein